MTIFGIGGFEVLLIGAIALLYLFKRFKRQFSQIEKDHKCDDCPVIDKINK